MPVSQGTNDLAIEISPERLCASIVAQPAAITRNWTVAELRLLCASAGLSMTTELEQRLGTLEDARKRPPGTNRFEIAHGTPPVNAQAASLLFTHAAGFVKKGETLGQIEPARAGSDGVDVLGASIAHTPCTEQHPAIPPMVRVEQSILLADADGYYQTDGLTAQIDPVTTVEKLEASERVQVFDRTVLVHGNISKGATIEAKRSLLVEGSIDSTMITVANDVCVDGVFGRVLGQYNVGRNMRANFLRQAHVVIGGNLTVKEEISESDIACVGKVFAPTADIRGGRVHAEEGIDVNIVGNDSLVKTLLEIGIDLAFETLLNEKRNTITAGRKHVERVRMHVAPLMANPKRLTNTQKEKATELLFEADELQARITSDLDELQRGLAHMAKRAESSLTVRTAIFPGTTIRFQGVETTIRSTLHGPCRIVMTDIGEKPRIVAFIGTSTTPQVLESRSTQRNVFAEMRKLAA